jgi:hypothetical protein
VIKTSFPDGAGVDALVLHERGRHHPSKLIDDVYVNHERKKERDEDY